MILVHGLASLQQGLLLLGTFKSSQQVGTSFSPGLMMYSYLAGLLRMILVHGLASLQGLLRCIGSSRRGRRDTLEGAGMHWSRRGWGGVGGAGMH
jgi:hypothetical protein